MEFRSFLVRTIPPSEALLSGLTENSVKRLLVPVLCTTICLLGFSLASVISAPLQDEKSERKSRAREDFELMRLFAEVYEQIDSRYVREVDRRELVDNAVRGMLKGLDPHSSWIPPQDLDRFEQYLGQEFIGIGIQVQLDDDVPKVLVALPGSPAWRSGIRPGDTLTSVDGTALKALDREQIADLIRGPVGQQIEVVGRHAETDETYTVKLTREKIQLETVTGVRRSDEGGWDWFLKPAEKVTYLRLSHFSRNSVDEFRSALQQISDLQAGALIIDLRSNPGGLIEAVVEMADMLLDTGRIVSMKGRAVSERVWEANKGMEIPTEMKLVVLIDRQSASASEILSAALQDHDRAVIVGERSFGKGSVQNVVKMEGGRSALKLTTARYFRPSGVNIHRFPDADDDDEWGVRPDMEQDVHLADDIWQELRRDRDGHQGLSSAGDVAAVIARDPQLQRALECINAMPQK